MNNSRLSIVAVATVLLGCAGGAPRPATDSDHDDLPLVNDSIEIDCEEVANYADLIGILSKSRNSDDPDILGLRISIEKAIARCDEVKLARQAENIPPHWKSFEFNDRTYYYTPLNGARTN